MDFGVNFFPSVGPADKSAETYFAEALDLVGLLDELGFGHVRTVEHYFEPYGGYSPNPVGLPGRRGPALASMRASSPAPCCRSSINPLKLAGELGRCSTRFQTAASISASPAPSCRTNSSPSAATSTRAASASPRASIRSAGSWPRRT